MGIIVNGTDRTDVIVNGSSVTGVIVNGVNRLTDSGATTRDFTQTDAGLAFSVNNRGVVTFTISAGTLVTQTYRNNQSIGIVSSSTTRTNSGTLRVPNDSTMWDNANEVISFSIQATQAAAPAFGFSDAGVSCSVDSSGNVNASSTIGTASLGSGQPSSYSLVTTPTSRTISVRVRGTVPAGYSNSHTSFDLTGNCPATQPAAVIPTFGSSDAGVTCSVDGQTGDVTVDSDHGTAVLRSGQVSSYATVSSPTRRSIRVRVSGTVPGGYTNTGNRFSFDLTCTTTQPAFQEENFRESDWTGSVSVDALGQVLENRGNATSISTVPSSFSQNNGSNARDVTFTRITLGVPSGYGNSGSTISFSRTVSQPSSLPVFESTDWTGRVQVNTDGRVLVSAGNGGPLGTFSPTRFAANTGTTAILRTVTVNVTIPAGYRNFGRMLEIRRIASQAAPTIEYDNVITISESELGYNANFFRRTLTGSSGNVVNTTLTLNPAAGYSLTANRVRTSSTNTVIASPGRPTLNASIGVVNIPISSTIGNADNSATITVSGGATRTASFTIGGQTSRLSIARRSTSRTITFDANESWEIWENVSLYNGFSFVRNGSVSDLGVSISPSSGSGDALVRITNSGSPISGITRGIVFFVPRGATSVLPYSVQLEITNL